MAVKFYTVGDLVMHLSEAKRGGTLERLSKDIGRTDLLILDECNCCSEPLQTATRAEVS